MSKNKNVAILFALLFICVSPAFIWCGTAAEDRDRKSVATKLPESVRLTAAMYLHAVPVNEQTGEKAYHATQIFTAIVCVRVSNVSDNSVSIPISAIAPHLFYVSDPTGQLLGRAPGARPDLAYDLNAKISLSPKRDIELAFRPFGSYIKLSVNPKGVYILRHPTHKELVIAFSLDEKGEVTVYNDAADGTSKGGSKEINEKPKK